MASATHALPTWAVPAAPPDPAADFHAKIAAFLDSIKTDAADGISLADFGKAIQALIFLAVEFAFGVAVDGPQKKQLVLDAVAAAYDRLIDFLPVPWWLAIVWPLVAPSLRAMVLDWADGAIETVYQFLRAKLPANALPKPPEPAK